MKESLLVFLKDENGASLAEYALLIALVVLVVIGTLTTLGISISGKFGSFSTSLGS